MQRPAGWLRTGSALMKYTNGSWGVCRSQGYVYNANQSDALFAHVNWGTACGAGSYRTWANGAAYWNDAWRGGGNIISPTHGFSG